MDSEDKKMRGQNFDFKNGTGFDIKVTNQKKGKRCRENSTSAVFSRSIYQNQFYNFLARIESSEIVPGPNQKLFMGIKCQEMNIQKMFPAEAHLQQWMQNLDVKVPFKNNRFALSFLVDGLNLPIDFQAADVPKNYNPSILIKSRWNMGHYVQAFASAELSTFILK